MSTSSAGPISIHPGNAKVSPGESATLEDSATRQSLPEYQDIPAALDSELTPALSEAALTSASLPAAPGDWTRSQSDLAGTRYSRLDQINKENVTSLQMAWVYHSKDGKANIQCTPVIVQGILYAPTAGNNVVAVDANSGAEIWRFHPGGHPAQRGLTYWAGTQSAPPRIFFTSGPYLFALDPKTGQPLASFGRSGKVSSGGVVAPVVYKDVVVTANFNVITGFDVSTGRLLWKFDVLPPPTNSNDDGTDIGGNVWSGIALDAGRGIVFLAATGSPHPNFVGIDHPGDNKYANCVTALDAQTGKLLWSFQEIRHDIWDLDFRPLQPGHRNA